MTCGATFHRPIEPVDGSTCSHTLHCAMTKRGMTANTRQWTWPCHSTTAALHKGQPAIVCRQSNLSGTRAIFSRCRHRRFSWSSTGSVRCNSQKLASRCLHDLCFRTTEPILLEVLRLGRASSICAMSILFTLSPAIDLRILHAPYLRQLFGERRMTQMLLDWYSRVVLPYTATEFC